MDIPLTTPESGSDESGPAAPAMRSEPRSRLFWVGLALAVSFAGFLTLPLAALYCYAPLRLLRIGRCCFVAGQALGLSLSTSLFTTFLAFTVGTPVAYTIARNRFPGRRVLETLIELPITLPPIVAGVALLLVFGRQGFLGRHLSVFGIQLSFTRAAVVLAQFAVAAPYYVRTAIGAFETVPPHLLNASRTLGAGPIGTFFRVSLPFCRRLLLAGLVLTWARAMGEFGATIMFAGNFPGRTQTMPLAILTMMQQNLQAGIVLSVIMLTVCLGVFFIVRLLVGRRVDLTRPFETR
ncbi:MAG: molybdate ABC transporter permease subunit [Kiritimatiellaeota bacterium]|nr:molybdate ABC transporter permease subunit [Kiritimatiellota bacterium]